LADFHKGKFSRNKKSVQQHQSGDKAHHQRDLAKMELSFQTSLSGLFGEILLFGDDCPVPYIRLKDAPGFRSGPKNLPAAADGFTPAIMTAHEARKTMMRKTRPACCRQTMPIPGSLNGYAATRLHVLI
jgi:hypothetical protein